MTQTTINRRKALTVVAAVPAAVALGVVPAFAIGEPGQLAALIRRYWVEVDVFNNTKHLTDEESDAHAEATFDVTMSQMVGVPARSAGDAHAALDWIIREGEHSMVEFDADGSLYARVNTSLMNAARDYIASTA